MQNLGDITNPKDLVTKEYVDGQVSAKYSKPSTGIPKSDLSSGAQTSLDKADRATRNYELIKTVTLEEAVNLVEITTDDNGDPISLQAALFRVTNATYASSSWIKIDVYSRNSHPNLGYYRSQTTAAAWVDTGNPPALAVQILEMRRVNGLSLGLLGYATTNPGAAASYPLRVGGERVLFEDDPWIKVTLSYNGYFSVGTKIELYGVKS